MDFTRTVLPAPEDFQLYRKTTLTPMTRIDGPFTVETREGFITCADGWLAIDRGGWPYPVAADEHAEVYELALEAP